MTVTKAPDIEEIRDTLSFLEDWEDRYRYVIELGRTLDPLSDSERVDTNKVRGCASQVWLVPEHQGAGADTLLRYRGDSDAHIVKGLVAIVVALFSGKRAREAATIDARGFFDGLGLSQHLTAQRANGLFSMVERIQAEARRLAAA